LKKNLPVTQQEQPFPSGRYIVSRTDLKGAITHVNDTFVTLSGFERGELVGRNHNVVRHPDMPTQAFANLWATLKAGLPWRGIVKNRCKNGDHYWVDALIVPVRKNDETIGYMSVRTQPDREQVRQAEQQYRQLTESGKPLPGPDKAGISLRGRLIGLAVALVVLQLISNALELLGGAGIAWLAHLLGAGGVLAGMLLVFWQHQTLKGVENATRLMDRIAQGNLTDAIPTGHRDELGKMYNAMTAMQAHLKVMLAEIDEAGERIKRDVSQLEDEMNVIYQESSQQSESVSHIAASVEELSAAAREVAAGADATAHAVQESRDVLSGVVTQMRDGREASRRVVETVERASDTICHLSEAVQQIGKVSNGIKEIAEQTNLLALNAAIEAARAGEAGRGFAVVADEVRKLAERAGAQTGEINHTVDDIQTVTQSALSAMEQAGRQVDDAEQAMSHSDQGLAQVAEKEDAMHVMAHRIASAAAEESQTTGGIATHLARISDGIGDNVAHVENARQRTINLSRIADELRTLIGYFHFDRS
jgi:aerotaxis receptor